MKKLWIRLTALIKRRLMTWALHELEKAGFYACQLKRVGDTDYIQIPGSAEYRRIGRGK